MVITNETRYFLPEDKYMEFYQEVDFSPHIRKELMIKTDYSDSFNIETSLLNQEEIDFLNNETGLDISKIKIINFWH